jgi:alpha-galactosidase
LGKSLCPRGRLNHFSVVLEARYKDTGRDAYPDIRAKAPDIFERLPDLREHIAQLEREQAGSTRVQNQHSVRAPVRARALALQNHPGEVRLSTLTNDSHRQYIQWAHMWWP